MPGAGVQVPRGTGRSVLVWTGCAWEKTDTPEAGLVLCPASGLPVGSSSALLVKRDGCVDPWAWGGVGEQ